MKTLQEKYNAVLEGNFSKTQFRRDAAIEMPQFVSTVNSFDDTVAILKNKGAITEAKKQEPKYSTAKPADQVAPDVLDTGIKFELDKKYGTLDVTPEQYEKCKEMAIKNLAKDVLYYVKQDSEQLEAPGEKMEKAKLKEVKSKEANLNEGRYSINLKAAMDALNKSEYVDGVEIRQGNKFTGIKSIDVNTRLIGDLVVTKDGEVFWPYKDRTWGWDSPSIEHLIKTIEEVSAEEELNPSNDYKLTEVNEDVIDELKVKVSIPGQEEFEAEEGKDYSEEEADKYIDNAKKSGATPMNTKFTKVNEEEVEEGNAFSGARAEAIKNGEKEFTVDGKTYPVEDEEDEVQKESKKNVVTLSESEMIELIQRLVMEQKEAKGLKDTEKTLKDSKKVNDEAMKEVNKKMKDYENKMKALAFSYLGLIIILLWMIFNS